MQSNETNISESFQANHPTVQQELISDVSILPSIDDGKSSNTIIILVITTIALFLIYKLCKNIISH